MAYIYKITNDINNKVYIGKTEQDIDKRFAEHCSDSKKERCKNRPLYRAMNKYGVEHFCIELLEKTVNPEEREIYWIQYYDSYHHGYNVTRGGDGKKYLNYANVLEIYKKVQNISETAKICNISHDSVRTIVRSFGVVTKSSGEILREKCSKIVAMYDIESNLQLEIFSSIIAAAQYLVDNNLAKAKKANDITSHIANVCNGKRKTAYGFSWRYIEK